jgi:tubulin alpha
MIKCNPANGKYMACCLLYSGDVTPKEVIQTIPSIRSKRTVNFVQWCPTGFKISINERSPFNVKEKSLGKHEKSCCMLSNNSSMTDIFDFM